MSSWTDEQYAAYIRSHPQTAKRMRDKAEQATKPRIQKHTGPQTLVYHGRLPATNEINNAQRSGPQVGARLKRKTQEDIEWQFKPQVRGQYGGKVEIAIRFYEPNRKRDEDNVIGGCKFLLDALQELQVIANDSPKYCHIKPEVFYDTDARIEIEIKETI